MQIIYCIKDMNESLSKISQIYVTWLMHSKSNLQVHTYLMIYYCHFITSIGTMYIYCCLKNESVKYGSCG